ncbi:MAG: hypothetical protein KDC53_15850 [Saprospiraceae bacterium]|nr:hypothetical protein [Saprospiraceae bacterium]
MTFIYQITLLILPLWYTVFTTPSGDEWSLVRENETLEVYKRTNSDGYKDIRIEAIFHCSIDDLVKSLDQVDQYPQWVYKCTGAEKIGSTASGHLLRYWMVSDFPFPFKDRELVVVSSAYIDTDGIYHSNSHAEKVQLRDLDNILVDKFDSSWVVTDLKDGRIYIEYEVSARPGGLIPSWLYNMAVDHGPFKTMESLQQLLEEST